ncbi:hypothetical protein EUGRSUZ_L01259 [Eucalyptus grandis]|uniref:Uncharacterized protein n=1 Tax=Eucalyptus grandis TaxID=71139 RepID=A0A058ZTK6_EUCGR|nr:hypothetical protein EUGRSUZ_L01259 [Eucalyptus grandis]
MGMRTEIFGEYLKEDSIGSRKCAEHLAGQVGLGHPENKDQIFRRDHYCTSIFSNVIKYGFVILFNVTMWGCYVNSLKSLSSLQATVTNFSTNFLPSGLAGFFFF